MVLHSVGNRGNMDISSPYQPLRPSSEGPNPLRPYYRPPSIGNPPGADIPNATKAGGSAGSSGSNTFSGFSYAEVVGEARGLGGGVSFKALLDDAVWKYTSVFMAQPFEVAKMVLQVRLNEMVDEERGSVSASASGSRARHADPSAYDSSSDSDSPSYFTSAAPTSSSHAPKSPTKRHKHHQHSQPPHRSSTRDRTPTNHPLHRLHLKKPNSLTEVLSQLWSREAAWGITKGTNITFLYSLLFKTLELWSRAALAALLNLPDPGPNTSLTPSLAGGTSGLDIIDSPSPLASLGIAVTAAAVAGAVLAPLDIVRTRLMLTPSNTTTRGVIPCLRSLRSWTVPRDLLPATVLHATLPSIFNTVTPLALRSTAGIDPVVTPAAYSVSTFLAAGTELFVRLPVETVLRRGQMRTVLASEQARAAEEEKERSASRGRSRGGRYVSAEGEDDVDDEDGAGAARKQSLDTVVEIGPYTGLIATMWRIARDEGERVEGPVQARPGVRRKKRGQGVQGLWRGWRVGWWGLVGVWGASALGGAGGKGGEF